MGKWLAGIIGTVIASVLTAVIVDRLNDDRDVRQLELKRDLVRQQQKLETLRQGRPGSSRDDRTPDESDGALGEVPTEDNPWPPADRRHPGVRQDILEGLVEPDGDRYYREPIDAYGGERFSARSFCQMTGAVGEVHDLPTPALAQEGAVAICVANGGVPDCCIQGTVLLH